MKPWREEKKAIAEERRVLGEKKEEGCTHALADEKKREMAEARQQQKEGKMKMNEEDDEPEWKVEWYELMKKRPGDPAETMAAKRARIGAEVRFIKFSLVIFC